MAEQIEVRPSKIAQETEEKIISNLREGETAWINAGKALICCNNNKYYLMFQNPVTQKLCRNFTEYVESRIGKSASYCWKCILAVQVIEQKKLTEERASKMGVERLLISRSVGIEHAESMPWDKLQEKYKETRSRQKNKITDPAPVERWRPDLNFPMDFKKDWFDPAKDRFEREHDLKEPISISEFVMRIVENYKMSPELEKTGLTAAHTPDGEKVSLPYNCWLKFCELTGVDMHNPMSKQIMKEAKDLLKAKYPLEAIFMTMEIAHKKQGVYFRNLQQVKRTIDNVMKEAKIEKPK